MEIDDMYSLEDQVEICEFCFAIISSGHAKKHYKIVHNEEVVE